MKLHASLKRSGLVQEPVTSPHPLFLISLQTADQATSGNHNLAIGTLTDLARSKRDLVAENALLRQQLIVLNRQIERPKLTQKERLFMVIRARFTSGWKRALFIIQPAALLKWHRQGFRLFWGNKTGHNQTHLSCTG